MKIASGNWLRCGITRLNQYITRLLKRGHSGKGPHSNAMKSPAIGVYGTDRDRIVPSTPDLATELARGNCRGEGAQLQIAVVSRGQFAAIIDPRQIEGFDQDSRGALLGKAELQSRAVGQIDQTVGWKGPRSFTRNTTLRSLPRLVTRT